MMQSQITLVDAMAHLEDPRIPDLDAVLNRAISGGVVWIVNAGVLPSQDSTRQLNLPSGDQMRVAQAFGLHPQKVAPATLASELDTLDALMVTRHAVAIGETGIDLRDDMPPLELQQEAFRRQIQLAKTKHKPLIIHAVRSHGHVLDILREAGDLPAGGMVHGFTGTQEVMNNYLELGLYISLGGLVSDPKARKCRESAREIPLDRLLVESDTPDHPPRGWPGSTSEPVSIGHTLRSVAELRNDPFRVLADATSENARRLFLLG